MMFNWREYLILCKPKVVTLMLLTAVVGMFLATPGMVPLSILFFGTLGIALAAGSAAVVNHIMDQRIDLIMHRTKRRPLPSGTISTKKALFFAFILGLLGMVILCTQINLLTAFLTFLGLLGYAVIYTMFLKRATPQNIVIGGLAGALPPLLGWTAVTGELSANSLLLVLIIYAWTPPHFWALSIYRYEDYKKAKIPMLPITHGIEVTKWYILFYTLLMFAVTLLPFVTQMSGLIYLFGAIVLGIGFLAYAIVLLRTQRRQVAMSTFKYSIIYLMLLFIFLLVDHYFFF